MLGERGWSSRRKRASAVGALAANDFKNQAASHLTAEKQIALDIVSGQLRIGRRILVKAEEFVETATSAKTLSSAASAARSGAALARQAAGLDLPGAVPGIVAFDFSFAQQAAHLFTPEGRGQAAAAKALRDGAVVEIETSPEGK